MSDQNATTWTSDAAVFAKQRFDYIVVGSGTAGSVIASRLSEDPDVVVGLIEAGERSSENASIDIPGRYGESLGSSYDYAYKTVPQTAADNRQVDVPRGKGLGGTSLLNFMVWMRPNAIDIDYWNELGNKGWTWDSLLPYFRKSESLLKPTAQEQQQYRCHVDDRHHGHSGPVPVRLCKELCFAGQPFQETLNELGVPTNDEAYAGSNAGVFSSLVNVDHHTGYRAHAAQTYLHPHLNRRNLHVLTGSEVDKIVLESASVGHRATGVSIKGPGDTPLIVPAEQEVIVSCGSFYSPVLLEKSGIGRPDVLEKLGITVEVPNQNVGERYQDHSMLSIVYEIDPKSVSRDDLSDEKLAAQADAQFKIDQTGPRALLSTTLAYLNMQQFAGPELVDSTVNAATAGIAPTSIYAENKTVGQMEYIPIVGQISPYFQAEAGKKYLTLLQIQQYPFSSGSIHATVQDGKIFPRIDPKVFEGPYGEVDLNLHALAFDTIVRKIESSKPLSGLLQKRVWPPADMTGLDEYREWMKKTATFDWHPVGTCRMGGSEGADAGVVDSRLRVYGVEGLRVVDASIMPRQICAHPQATITAIAERASDLIKQDRKV